MNKKIKEQIDIFKIDISNFESQKTNTDINSIIASLKTNIVENTRKYFNIDDLILKEKIKVDLIRDYNLLYYYQAKEYGLGRAYLLGERLEKLPNIYMIEQVPERFEIDEELLKEINVSEGLTNEQALELLRWTVNNTRDNLAFEGMNSRGVSEDVYGNSSLMGACGFSQFSTLYPLEQLGLKVTINNVGQFCGERHACGTVVIPIRDEGKIIEKRFLLDCTYRQFFTLPFNVAARYLSHSPSVGFFVSLDEKQIEFAKELLKNGFVEASEENMEKYFKPFFYGATKVDGILSVDKRIDEINFTEEIERKQEEFDYTEEEFVEWGLNLDFSSQKNKVL